MTPATRQRPSSHWTGRRLTHDQVLGVLYLAPAALVLAVGVGYVLLYSLGLSFHRWDLSTADSAWEFVGIANYLDLARSTQFHNSVLRTVLFVVAAVGIEFVLGLTVALVTSAEARAMRVVRSLILIPFVITPVVAGILWRMLLNGNVGLVNYFLSLVGIPKLNWLGDANLAMVSIILVDVWVNTPLVIIILVAGLTSLPNEPLEAALIDGASRWQQFWHVTFPLLAPLMGVALVLRVTDAMKVFATVFVLTDGGPGTATEVMNIFIFNQALRYLNVGFASATSWVFLIAVVAASLYVVKRNVATLLGRG